MYEEQAVNGELIQSFPIKCHALLLPLSTVWASDKLYSIDTWTMPCKQREAYD